MFVHWTAWGGAESGCCASDPQSAKGLYPSAVLLLRHPWVCVEAPLEMHGKLGPVQVWGLSAGGGAAAHDALELC